MAPPGTTLGYVVQEWSIIYPRFRIENAAHETVLRIEGPACRWSCCCNDVVFHVLSKDGRTQVGRISKQWSGLLKEAFTDAENFGISFPMDMDTSIKGVLIGAAFLIELGLNYNVQHGQKQDIPPDVSNMLIVAPVPRNMHHEHNGGERQAPAKALLCALLA
ncbi:hypothetical protein HPB50_005111 [Hyalomma asiaticum]|uniref:Uncharacterized protein n=1 Tax=Hyalomma asiaticum TaxID=266040 RepID=A0ACB7STH1_HYAAI|nr:hypothetical protein HPB50_005111 [Hyalomma asiaticum]